MRQVIKLTGVLSACAISYFIGYCVQQKQSLVVKSYDAKRTLTKLSNSSANWMKDARFVELGEYTIMFPSDYGSSGSFCLFVKAGFPLIVATDSSNDGFLNELSVKDSNMKAIGVTFDTTTLNIDTAFFTVSGTPGIDAITLIDEDLDGGFDIQYSDKEGISRF